MQSKRNFSAKREAIYETLAFTKSHPTAEWVYQHLKTSIPDLSLGTVYRNLNVFKEMGLAKSVGVVNGQERFDVDLSQHPHFICTRCGRITDVPKGRNFIDSNTYDFVSNECAAVVQTHNITFYGLCRECSEKE